MAVPTKKKGSARREERRRSKAAAAKTRSRRNHGVNDDEDDDDLFEDDENFDRNGVAAQLISRYGTAQAALTQVMGERYRESRKRRRLREQLEEAEEENEELRERLGIKDDEDLPEKAVVMSEEDKAELDAYRALVPGETDSKKRIEAVKTKVEEHGTLKQKATEAEGKELRSKAAKAAGDWDVDVLSTLVNQHNLVLELKEVEKEGGEKELVPFARENKEGSTAVRLTEYVEKNEVAKKMLPALTAKSEGDNAPPLRRGTPYPRTSGGGTKGQTDVASNVLGGRDVRPSARRAGADSTKT